MIKLVTIFYREYAKDHKFKGEAHDFWEFVYVDKGEVTVTADDNQYVLTSGMVIFHKPNEFHRFYASNGTAPNIVVISFESSSRQMKAFEKLVILLNDEERNLLSYAVREAKHAFVFPFKYPLVKKENALIGCEQFIGLYIEAFLLQILRRRCLQKSLHPRLSSAPKEKEDLDWVKLITQFMLENIDRTLSIKEISGSINISQTKLKDLFKKRTGETVMNYFIREKMEKAKTMIREEKYNYTEISQILGFSSLHQFSRSFKSKMGMSPTEYAKSVKARIDSRGN